jgi:hypothetical protein
MTMKRGEIEGLLRDHVRGVHEELETLMHGVERALASHLERTEAAIADAFEAERGDVDSRFGELDQRLRRLESR